MKPKEVKFRAWSYQNKEMYYWGDGFNYRWFECEPTCHAIMQFTGLKDCKGNDIWEGDILKPAKNPKGNPKYYFINYEVYYDKYKWRLIGKLGSTLNFGIVNDARIKWEVVGNIYENSELLT